MNKKKKRKRKSNWTPPRNYTDFFSPEADQEFKRKHPIGYPALVMLGMLYDNGNKIKQADSEYEAADKPKHNPSAFCPIY